MKQHIGFTLLELIIVLAIVGILFAVGFSALGGFRQRLELRNAQNNFVEALNQARSDARKTSENHTVIWSGNSLEVERGGEIVRTVKLTDSDRIRVVRQSGNNDVLSGKIRYSAPYGRTTATPFTYAVQETNTGRELLVIVYGVTGKVKAVAR